ncbi:MAG TPA: hypothetical protein VEW67_05680 [Thermoleophilaceae bacterium]|nr:hypothetical protein [Thermoleophilaceae bacterium]
MAGARLMVFAAVAGLLLAFGASGSAGRETAAGGEMTVALGDERTDLRTRTSRTFAHESGGNVTRVYQGPVNFRDDRGDWRLIDNDLVRSEAGGFENAANRYQLDLPSDAGKAPVRLAAGADWVDFRLRNVAGAPDVDGSAATYSDVREGLSLAYTATADGVKEEIWLDSPAAARDLVFDMRLSPGLTPRMRRDGGLDLIDGEGGRRFHVERPFMVDSSEGAEPSYAVSYELERVEGGYALSVRPDRD